MTVPIEGVAVNFEGEVLGSTVSLSIDESLLGDVNGRFRGAYLTLSSDESTTSSQRFDVDVLESFSPASDEPADEPTEPTDDPTEPADDPTCGCSEGSLTDEDIDDLFGGE